MDIIQKITIKYIPKEDRLRLAVLLKSGEATTFWLTARLAGAVVDCLLQRLNELSPAAVTDAGTMQQWEQAAAMQEYQATSAVPVDAGRHALVESVDVSVRGGLFVLVFRGVSLSPVQFTSTPVQMRQWLQIVYSQCVEANWSLDVWPDWIRQPLAASNAPLRFGLN